MGMWSKIAAIAAVVFAASAFAGSAGAQICKWPTIETQPRSQTADFGSDVTFFVELTGTPPFIYQWRMNAVNLPWATEYDLLLRSVTLADAGQYDVLCLNACGSAVSDPASLTVVLAGDYNLSGTVDAADYVRWRNALAGTGVLHNETASLGVVDDADYDLWKAHFGDTAGSGALSDATVPEPSALCLAALVSLAFLARRRCHL
jgi:hypothetical protein